MAPSQPTQGKGGATSSAMSFYSFRRVFRAARQETAGRRQQGRYQQL